jgi:predicted tellurium resistance membrane protein TerC
MVSSSQFIDLFMDAFVFLKKKETAVIRAVGASLLTAESSDKLPHNYISGLVFGEALTIRYQQKAADCSVLHRSNTCCTIFINRPTAQSGEDSVS